MTIRNGSRTGTFKAFAEKYVDDKLSVLTFTHVNKVIFKGKTALGIEVFYHELIMIVNQISIERCPDLVKLANTLPGKKSFYLQGQLGLHKS